MNALLPRTLTALLAATLLLFALPSCSSDETVAPSLETATPATSRGDASECVSHADPDASLARVWNEEALSAVRRDFPAPTVHSRNLFHLSMVMWDAWASYGTTGTGWFVDQDLDVSTMSADEIADARDEAISYAAHRLLRHRYSLSTGALESVTSFDGAMRRHCYEIGVAHEPGSPAAVGIAIADEAIDATLEDGAAELIGYEAPYEVANDPMPVDGRGTSMTDPNRWQPLSFEIAFSQTGQSLASGPQQYIGPHWGSVTPFALEPDSGPLPIDPGPPPYLGNADTDAAFKEAIVEVIAASATLDPTDQIMIDISPAVRGASSLGADDGQGHETNPVTGATYEPNEVPAADWGRVIAEFWADGPESETPPGHWNTIANTVSDHPDLELRFGGQGPELGRLEWDLRMYVALNGALHDAAIAAWGAKAHYDYVRPVSMIRHMGGLGQSSDPSGPSHHPDGLPLVEDLIEVITDASVADGRHAHLASHIGAVAVRAWIGPDLGVDWMLAEDWLPYQRDTFVTPAFPGYVSGHSTFSRAAATVLEELTGSPYFPGGLGQWTVSAGHLEFEQGPSTDITLQWATYDDAADEAGRSRIYGGIHVEADDLAGRIMGQQCGEDAWQVAIALFDAT